MQCSPAESDSGDLWLELNLEVSEELVALAAHALLELGATGTREDHPGLHFGDDQGGPIVSGDPRSWTPALPANPTGIVQLTAWFGADRDREALLAAATAALAALGIEPCVPQLSELADRDWNATWKAGFTSFRLSPRIQVVPSWRAGSDLDAGIHTLQLDPGMAFGTGTHFTTAACAQLLDALLASAEAPPRALLDVGTGTGILALVGLLLGVPRAVAVDADPQALTASRENARINGLEYGLDLHLGGPDAAPRERFPIVLANLIAPLLLDLAADLSARLEPGASLIISGILCAQEAEVAASLATFGLQAAERLSDGEWVALRLQRPAGGPRS
jgi:ribosomal protein L11 methyltransferase